MKLTKNEAWSLVKKMINYWSIREHALENMEICLDQYVNDCGYHVFEQALKWEKGISLNDRREFTRSLFSSDRDWMRQNNWEDEMPDLEAVHQVILELTRDVLSDVIDLNIKPLSASIEERTVEKVVKFWNCPNCKHENPDPFNKTEGVKCRRCNILVDIN